MINLILGAQFYAWLKILSFLAAETTPLQRVESAYMPQPPSFAKMDLCHTKRTLSPHSAYGINYHLVWIPRYRKRVLVGRVEERLKERLAEIATQYGFEIWAVEVMPEAVFQPTVSIG